MEKWGGGGEREKICRFTLLRNNTHAHTQLPMVNSPHPDPKHYNKVAHSPAKMAKVEAIRKYVQRDVATTNIIMSNTAIIKNINDHY